MAESGNFYAYYISSAFKLRVVWNETDISVSGIESKVKAIAYLDMSSGASLNIAARTNTFTINGKNYSFSSSAISKSAGSAKSVKLGEVTSDAIKHNDDGSKAVTIKCVFNINATIGGKKYASFTVSKSVSLTKIARLSSVYATNGTLGSAQKLTVTKQNESYTHTITYECGSVSGTICEKSSETTIDFTPPLSLAAQNTKGTSVSLTFIITTFSNSNSLGSTKKTVTCAIPVSVAPSVSITFEDTEGYAATYGNPIQGKSKLKISLSEKIAAAADISFYSIVANDETFTLNPCTTSELKKIGTQKITAKVTDTRGRSGTAEKDFEVLAYEKPKITSLNVRRCKQDGSIYDQGEYIKVTFSGEVSSLNNKNTAVWKLQKKKPKGDSYDEIPLTVLRNQYSVSEYSYIFEADTESSYFVNLVVTDNFDSDTRYTVASTAMTIAHVKSDGKGISLGKICELVNVFDVGFQTRFYGGIRLMEINQGFDVDNLTTPNFYVGINNSSTTYLHLPPNISGTFLLEVLSAGAEGQLVQRLTSCNKENQLTYQRFFYSKSWGNWHLIYGSCQNYTFEVSSDFTLGRAALSCQGGMVNLYSYVKSKNAIAKGETIQVGTIPEEIVPLQAVSSVGIVGSTGSCAAWIRVTDTEKGVFVRPFVDAEANISFEFNLNWNIATNWQN